MSISCFVYLCSEKVIANVSSPCQLPWCLITFCLITFSHLQEWQTNFLCRRPHRATITRWRMTVRCFGIYIHPSKHGSDRKEHRCWFYYKGYEKDHNSKIPTSLCHPLLLCHHLIQPFEHLFVSPCLPCISAASLLKKIICHTWELKKLKIKYMLTSSTQIKLLKALTMILTETAAFYSF